MQLFYVVYYYTRPIINFLTWIWHSQYHSSHTGLPLLLTTFCLLVILWICHQQRVINVSYVKILYIKSSRSSVEIISLYFSCNVLSGCTRAWFYTGSFCSLPVNWHGLLGIILSALLLSLLAKSVLFLPFTRTFRELIHYPSAGWLFSVQITRISFHLNSPSSISLCWLLFLLNALVWSMKRRYRSFLIFTVHSDRILIIQNSIYYPRVLTKLFSC